MNDHIIDLFETAQPFDEGELYQSQEYDLWSKTVLRIGDKIKELYGDEAEKLLADFLHAYFEVERFACLHYFYQGYLEGREE